MTNLEMLENIEHYVNTHWQDEAHSPGEEFLLNAVIDLVRVCKDLQEQLDNVVKTV